MSHNCVCVCVSVMTLLDHQPTLSQPFPFVYMRSNRSFTVYNSVFITVESVHKRIMFLCKWINLYALALPNIGGVFCVVGSWTESVLFSNIVYVLI